MIVLTDIKFMEKENVDKTKKIIENANSVIRSKKPNKAFLEKYPFIQVVGKPIVDKAFVALYQSKSQSFYVDVNDLHKVPNFINQLKNAKTKAEIKEDKKQKKYKSLILKTKESFFNALEDKKEDILCFSVNQNTYNDNKETFFRGAKHFLIQSHKEALLHMKKDDIEIEMIKIVDLFKMNEDTKMFINDHDILLSSLETINNKPEILYSESFDSLFTISVLEDHKILKNENKIKVKLLNETLNCNLKVKYGEDFISNTDLKTLKTLKSLNIEEFNKINITKAEINTYIEKIFNRTIENLQVLDDDKLLRDSFYKDFKEKIMKIKNKKLKVNFNINKKEWNKDNVIQSIIHSLLAQAFEVRERRLNGFRSSISRKIIRKNIEIDNFKSLFPNARNRKRELIFIRGETNSGKTYTAFEMAKEYESSLYAAPLRLLALEGQQEFQKRGILCSMLTGEERDEIKGATSVSSTVEMIDYTKEYDVAIIDEVQLINDPDRGHAWLEAIVGVNAKKVILVGAPDITGIIKDLAKYLQEPLEIKTFERKTKIEFDKNLFRNSMNNIGKLPPHSAVIAFSKKDVLNLKNRFEKCGNKVSVIYGALPPQVRRMETERFVNGETDVVIATDAIGMGLNLPIENIFFYKVEKFNGKEILPLEVSLVKQIVGRAGRYNKFDIGYVSALSNPTFDFIKSNFYKDSTVTEKQFKCSPNYAIINQVHELTDENSISKLLQNYNNAIKFDFDIKNHMNEYSYMIGRFIDEITNETTELISLQEKVKLVNAPISMDRGFKVFDYYKSAIKNILTLRKDSEVHPISIVYNKIESLTTETQNKTELSIKKIDLLSWLTFNFEEFSCLENDIQNKRTELNNALIKYLRDHTVQEDKDSLL